MLRIVVSLIVLALASPAWADAKSDAEAAAQANESGDHAAAIELYTRALGDAKLPAADRAGALYGRGTAYAGEDRYKEAVDDYSAAVSADSRLWDAYFSRAAALINIGSFDQALPDLDRLAAAVPDYPGLDYVRGRADLGRKDYNRAIADFTRARMVQPDNLASYIYRAAANEAAGKTEPAIADHGALIAASSLDTAEAKEAYRGARRWRGALYYAARNYPAALADFDVLIALDAADADALIRKAQVLYALGKYSDMIGDLAGMTKASSGENGVYPWPENARTDVEHRDEIVEDYNTRMSLPQADPFAFVLRARAYAALGQKDSAVADYAVAKQLAPGTAWIAAEADNGFDGTGGAGVSGLLLYAAAGAVLLLAAGGGYFLWRRRAA